MLPQTKATRIQFLNFTLPQMRAFHMSWVAFFLCFMGWFAIAPLTPVIAKDLKLTKDQMYNTFIASVGITILARLVIGVFCDKVGPRKTYTWLMLLGGLAVMAVGFATDYTTFFLARVFIGMIGASFVITQFHSTQMFASNCVGTANATGAGWGNMGAGATNSLMPLIFGGLVSWGCSEHMGWRLAMIVPGALMLCSGVAYYFLTQDCPAGNFEDLRKSGVEIENNKKAVKGGFLIACADYRVWLLAFVYAACFGVEVVMHGTAATNFQTLYKLDLGTAGLIAGAFGWLAIFARGLGGYISDKVANKSGLKGRVFTLATFLIGQGVAMLLLSFSTVLVGSVIWLLIFGLFVHMAAGGTYAVIPFINKKVLGSVAGIVGAGGNVGAMLGGFLLKVKGVSYWQAIMYMGIGVLVSSVTTLAIRFSTADETLASAEFAAGTANNALPLASGELVAGQ